MFVWLFYSADIVVIDKGIANLVYWRRKEEIKAVEGTDLNHLPLLML